MVIYARGGSEGTAVEAARRTGRRHGAEEAPLHAAPQSQAFV